MQFKVINKSITAEKQADGVIHIRGIANTGLEDLSGDTFTGNALQSIVEQATSHNLHLDHDTTLDGILGPITYAELTNDGVVIEADIVNTEYQQKILELLDGGTNFGLSVSGISMLDQNNMNDINNIALTEISLTPVPCDQNTMGSVTIAKSFAEAFQSIREETDILEVNKMAEEAIGKEEVIELINTAFNERREEFLEQIRGEIKSENEAKLTELEARIESIESQIGNNEEEETPVTPPEEGEIVEVEEEISESVPKFTEEEVRAAEEDEEEGTGAEDEEEEEEEDEKEEVEKNTEQLETIAKKIITEQLKEMFKAKNANELQFRYNEEPDKQEEEEGDGVKIKKSWTPSELAHIIAKK